MTSLGLRRVESWLACKCCAPRSVRASEFRKDRGEWRNPETDIGERLLSDFADRVRGVVSRQVSAVAETLRSTGNTGYAAAQEASLAMMDQQWGNLIRNAARPYIAEITRIGGEAGMAVVGSPVGSFSAGAPSVQAYVDRAVTRLAEDIRMGTTTRVADLIGNALDRGESIPQIAARIEDSGYDDIRAEAIARTESARAYSQGNIEGWEQTDLTVRKAWSLSPDACQWCSLVAQQYGADSKAIDLRTPFYAKGSVLVASDGSRLELDYDDVSAPPLHPRCRCALLPVVVD